MPSIYGQGEYGVDSYSSDIVNLKGINRIYIGCEPTNGKEANAVFDEFQLFNVEKSDADIQALFNATQPSTWTMDHQLLGHFENSLDAGNLFLNQYTVDWWRVYKKKSNDTQYKLIATIANNPELDTLEISDYDIANRTDYDYAIEGISTEGYISNKFEFTNAQTDFSGIWLTDKNTGLTFIFRYNRPDFAVNVETDRVEIKTFSKKPLVWRNQFKTKRGQLEAQLTSTTCNIKDEINKVLNMEGSNNLILKTDTGELMRVDIYNLNYVYSTETDNKLATVKCEYVELEDKNESPLVIQAVSNDGGGFNDITTSIIDGGVF